MTYKPTDQATIGRTDSIWHRGNGDSRCLRAQVRYDLSGIGDGSTNTFARRLGRHLPPPSPAFNTARQAALATAAVNAPPASGVPVPAPSVPVPVPRFLSTRPPGRPAPAASPPHHAPARQPRWGGGRRQEESKLPHPNSSCPQPSGTSPTRGPSGYLPYKKKQPDKRHAAGSPSRHPVHEPGEPGNPLSQAQAKPPFSFSSSRQFRGAPGSGSAMPGGGGAAATARWACAVLAALPLLAAAAAPGRYRAVFNFGDSLVDAGNLVTDGIPDYLATARLPYGQTYFGYPTGRCSDGRLVVDFIAQELGLPFLPPSKAKNASFARGANFAITGATALDTEFFQKRGLGKTVWNSGSLFTQIQWLRDLKPSLCNSAQECKEFFSKCLFIVGEFGGNDYNAPLFAGKDLKEAYKLMPHVVQGISDGVEQLIAEGAKDLIVPGVMPSGCFPVYLTMYTDPKEGHGSRTGCLKRFNTFSWVHNAMLKRALEKLRAKHPGVRIMYGDYFTPVIQFILQPEKFGFYKQLPRACCGAPGRGPYNFNLTAKCGEPGASACADPKTHWSWDGIHLTEAAYGHIARGWLHGPFGDQPIVQSS